MSDASEKGDKLSQSTIDFLMSESPIKLPRLHCHKMLRIFLQCIEDNDYESLNNEFNKYTLSDMIIFFNKCGDIFLNQVIVAAKTIIPFTFVVEKLHPQLIKETLKEKNYELFESLLISEYTIESSGGDLPAERNLRREKFYFLLKFDPEGIEKYIREKSSDKFMSSIITPKIKEDFENAFARYKQDPHKQIDTSIITSSRPRL